MTIVEERRTAAPDPVLRGRAADLGAVDAGLAAAMSGRGGVLLVDGQSGTGKSRLLRETRHRAERAGVRALSGQAFDGQTTLPFAPLLAATLGGEPPVGDAHAVRALGAHADLRYWVVHDLRNALAAAASRTPLVMILDDLQWADDSTLAAVRALTAGLRTSGVLWVLAARGSDAGPAARDTMAHLTREGARRIRLEPLPAPVTAAVVADVVGAPPGPGLLALAGQATGNPLALMELLRGLREENRLHLADGLVRVGGDALPRRFTGHVHQRLSRLGSEARRMMLVAAVLPQRFTAAQLAGLLQCRPTALVETLDELLRADLVVSEADHLRFHHELLRRAVLDIMPSSLRQALEHEAAAPASPPAPARAATRRPVAGWASLTESERRVVDLVAAGATNREAARQLYLSPHTVGTHIRHAFEKLGINSRVQLANMMRDNAA